MIASCCLFAVFAHVAGSAQAPSGQTTVKPVAGMPTVSLILSNCHSGMPKGKKT